MEKKLEKAEEKQRVAVIGSQQHFLDFAVDFAQNALELLESKTIDYSEEENAMINFENGAEFSGISTLQYWGSHLMKQVGAIGNYIKTGNVSAENPKESLKDVMNYAIIGAYIMMLNEQAEEDDCEGEEVKGTIADCEDEEIGDEDWKSEEINDDDDFVKNSEQKKSRRKKKSKKNNNSEKENEDGLT